MTEQDQTVKRCPIEHDGALADKREELLSELYRLREQDRRHGAEIKQLLRRLFRIKQRGREKYEPAYLDHLESLIRTHKAERGEIALEIGKVMRSLDILFDSELWFCEIMD